MCNSENPLFFFLSRRFKQPEVAAFYRCILSLTLTRPEISDRFFFLAIPWFDNSVYNGPAKRPKLEVFKGKNLDIVLFNGEEKRPVPKNNSIYLIAKSGTGSHSHQQMDIGTFVLETNGIRWCDDLGRDDYLPGYFDSKQRWTFYRNTNYCHNTLTIDNKLQYLKGEAKVIDYNANTNKPYAVMDMTPVYQEQAAAVFRTFRLMDDRTVEITDSVEMLSSRQTLQWSVLTKADVRCSGKRATFSREGKKFYMKIISPAEAEFSVSPAMKFHEIEKSVNGFSIVKVVVKNSRTHKIQILMSSKKV
ncbi:MAG: heparinase II/III family protein [Mangrovibacterium sp.]